MRKINKKRLRLVISTVIFACMAIYITQDIPDARRYHADEYRQKKSLEFINEKYGSYSAWKAIREKQCKEEIARSNEIQPNRDGGLLGFGLDEAREFDICMNVIVHYANDDEVYSNFLTSNGPRIALLFSASAVASWLLGFILIGIVDTVRNSIKRFVDWITTQDKK